VSAGIRADRNPGEIIMPKYIFVYHQAAGYVPGSDPNATLAWEKYFESICESVVDPGQPVFERSVVGQVGDSTQLGGYSVVEAKDLDEAVALAKHCPTLRSDGGVHIGELAELPPEHPASRLRDRLSRA
jgi:hypothetical protein